MGLRVCAHDRLDGSKPAATITRLMPNRLLPNLIAAGLLAGAGVAHAAEPITPPAPISVSPGTPTSVPNEPRPVPAAAQHPKPAPAAQSANCAELQRRYLQSQACFAPYRLANGGMDAEAFRHCTEVQDPSPRCGLPDLQQQ